MGVPKFYRWLSERYPLLNQPVKLRGAPQIDNLVCAPRRPCTRTASLQDACPSRGYSAHSCLAGERITTFWGNAHALVALLRLPSSQLQLFAPARFHLALPHSPTCVCARPSHTRAFPQYLDMNGVIHNCSHGAGTDVNTRMTEVRASSSVECAYRVRCWPVVAYTTRSCLCAL